MTFSKSYDFSGLLSAQITSLIEAEAKAAQTISEYIEEIGFEKTKDKTGEKSLGNLRNVEFETERQGNFGQMHKHKISMPLLSMIPIPSLSIEEAELDFALRVDDITEIETESDNGKTVTKRLEASKDSVLSRSFVTDNAARARRVRPSLKAGFVNKPSSQTKQTSETTMHANLNVKVKVSRGDFPSGIMKLLEIADLGLQDHEQKEPPKNEEV